VIQKEELGSEAPLAEVRDLVKACCTGQDSR
jgi:hypothetical protein